MVDPYKYSVSELFSFVHSEAFTQMLKRSNYGYLQQGPDTMKALYPVRSDSGEVGWLYQVYFKNRIYGNRLIEFILFTQRGNDQQVLNCWEKGYHSARINRIGPTEYLALVFQAQEGSNG